MFNRLVKPVITLKYFSTTIQVNIDINDKINLILNYDRGISGTTGRLEVSGLDINQCAIQEKDKLITGGRT